MIGSDILPGGPAVDGHAATRGARFHQSLVYAIQPVVANRRAAARAADLRPEIDPTRLDTGDPRW